MHYPEGPSGPWAKPPLPIENAAPDGPRSGESLKGNSLSGPTKSRDALVKSRESVVNTDLAERPAGNVIPFPASRSRSLISNGPVHRLLRTTYLNRPLDPRPALARMAIEKLWLRRMAEAEGNST